MRAIVFPISVTFLLYAGHGRPEAAKRFEEVAARLVQAFNAEDYKGIQGQFSRAMSEALPLEKSKVFFKGLLGQQGRIQKLDPPTFLLPNQAVFPVHFQKGMTLDMKIALDEQNKIAGLRFVPHTPAIPSPDHHETELFLPFKGRWLVFWGGDTAGLNQHHDVPNQRFAFDFVVVDEHGKTHQGDGEKNEDYYAFGQEVLAPADGVVTDVIRGVRDNTPGSMNPYSSLGNAVVIQHLDHELSILAHLKLGSIRVDAGDRVGRGQVLGLCGNSGNSSEPHLHYHLQNTPVIQDGTGIKCFFSDVRLIKDGQASSRARYSPIKGDVIISG